MTFFSSFYYGVGGHGNMACMDPVIWYQIIYRMFSMHAQLLHHTVISMN